MIPRGRLRRAARMVTGSLGADRAVATLGQLKGGAQKLGQMLALVSDGLPPELGARFGKLFAEAEPRPFAELRAQVPECVFEVEQVPFAAASLGQVHRARWLEDGRPVAVKLLYPGIADALRADLDNLDAAALPARAFGGASVMLAGLRESLLSELDLTREARHAATIAAALRPWPRLKVAVPLFASEVALVSPLLVGPPLHTVLRPAGPGPADPMRVAGDVVAAICGPVFSGHVVNGDAHPGNLLLLEDGLGVVDFGAVSPVPDVATLEATLDALMRGERHGALAGLGIRAAALERELQPLLGPLGPGAWDFGADTLMAELAEVKTRHPFALREVPFAADRLPLVRATLGLHHTLRRLDVRYPLGEALQQLRADARALASG